MSFFNQEIVTITFEWIFSNFKINNFYKFKIIKVIFKKHIYFMLLKFGKTTFNILIINK